MSLAPCSQACVSLARRVGRPSRRDTATVSAPAGGLLRLRPRQRRGAVPVRRGGALLPVALGRWPCWRGRAAGARGRAAPQPGRPGDAGRRAAVPVQPVCGPRHPPPLPPPLAPPAAPGLDALHAQGAQGAPGRLLRPHGAAATAAASVPCGALLAFSRLTRLLRRARRATRPSAAAAPCAASQTSRLCHCAWLWSPGAAVPTSMLQ
jgi:hypothetical protein